MLRQDNHRRSKLQESRAAKDYGGNRTPGSGNRWFQKGDVKTDAYLIECKTTTKASYSLKSGDIKLHWVHALMENKIPVFEIEFSEYGATCVVLDKNDFLALTEGNREFMRGTET